MTSIESIRDSLEWHCNETNNYHCRIVTEIEKDGINGLPALKVWPRTNEKGEYVKVSGWSTVLRDAFEYEKAGEVSVHARPGLITLQEVDR